MKRQRQEPPRLARRILKVWVPAELRDSIIADADEAFFRRVAAEGEWRAATWYWRELLHVPALRREAKHLRPLRSTGTAGTGLLRETVDDLAYGAWVLLKVPALTALAILAIGLGIGLPTTMFSIVNGVLRDLPFDDGGRLVSVTRTHRQLNWKSAGLPLSDFQDLSLEPIGFDGLGYFDTDNFDVTGLGEHPERISGAFLSYNMLDVLRVSPMIGRAFDRADATPASAPVVLLGHSLWVNRFGADDDVLKGTLRVNGEEHAIIGVMPEGFGFPSSHELWVPLRSSPAASVRGEGGWYSVMGRLAAGVSAERVQAGVDALARRLELAYPETNADIGLRVQSYTDLELGSEVSGILYLMLTVVSFVLLVACANVANLLLARAASRTRELAVRSALGATRARVVRQLLTESLLLSAAGGLLGIVIASACVWSFNHFTAGLEMAFWIDIRIDRAVLAFVGTLVVMGGLAAGAVPAIRASRADANDILKDESRGTGLHMGRVSRALVVVEVALSCALLVASGLMIKGVLKLQNLDLGLGEEAVFIADLELPARNYPTVDDRVAFFDRLEAELRALPGVSSASLTSTVPASGTWRGFVGFDDRASERWEDYPRTYYAQVSPAFFETFRMQLLQGRLFGESDRMGAGPVAIVNQRFAKEHFAGESPLGRRIRQGGPDSEAPWRTIVGVVSNAHIADPQDSDPNPAGVYLPLKQGAFPFTHIVLRSAGDPLAQTGAVRRILASLDPDLPIAEVNTLRQDVLNDKLIIRVFGLLFLLFGAAALFLASVGLYGVMAFSVRRRTRELGVRIALGAGAGRVLRSVLASGLKQLTIGLVLGLMLAAGLSRAMAMAFFQVDPWDKSVFALTSVALLAAGLLASLVPARRATQVDPMASLRHE